MRRRWQRCLQCLACSNQCQHHCHCRRVHSCHGSERRCNRCFPWPLFAISFASRRELRVSTPERLSSPGGEIVCLGLGGTAAWWACKATPTSLVCCWERGLHRPEEATISLWCCCYANDVPALPEWGSGLFGLPDLRRQASQPLASAVPAPLDYLTK